MEMLPAACQLSVTSIVGGNGTLIPRSHSRVTPSTRSRRNRALRPRSVGFSDWEHRRRDRTGSSARRAAARGFAVDLALIHTPSSGSFSITSTTICTITPPSEFLRTPQLPRGAHESRRRAASVRIRRDAPLVSGVSSWKWLSRTCCNRSRANISSIPPSPPNRSSHSSGGLLAAARPMALEHDVVPGGCNRGRVRRAAAKWPNLSSPGVTCRLKPHPRAAGAVSPLAFATGDALACRRRVSASNASPSNGTDSLEQPPIWRMAARPVSGLLLLSPGATPRGRRSSITSVASTSQLT